jgi:hypothetical protein
MILFFSGVSAPFFLLIFIAFGAYFTSSIIESEASEISTKPIRSYSRTATHENIISVESVSSNSNSVSRKFRRGVLNEKPSLINHYACPPTTIEALRKRYGTRRSIWGEWSCSDTRRFYRQQLPFCLQIDGCLGLSLEERAQLAAQARHALRLYSRERCHLPGRLVKHLLVGISLLEHFIFI